MPSGDTRTQTSRGAIWRIAFIIGLGSFLFGYNSAVINGSFDFMADPSQLGLDSLGQGLVSGALTLGAAFGTVFGSPLAGQFGFKRLLGTAAGVFLVGAVGCALSVNLPMMLLFRIAVGLMVGLVSSVIPMYLAQTSPSVLRGTISSLNGLMIVIGQLVAFSVNAVLGVSFADIAWVWRVAFVLASLPAIGLWIGLMRVPEAPRWLMTKGREEAALESLARTRNAEEAETDLRLLRTSIQEESGKHASIKQAVSHPWVLQILITGCMLGVTQQFAGINAIMYYGTQILQDSGFGQQAALIGNVVIGVVSCVAAAAGLVSVDRLGRKTLECGGLAICAACLLAVALISMLCGGAAWAPMTILVIVFIYIFVFQATVGQVTWVLNSEIFPPQYSAACTGISVFSLWAANFVVSLVFPLMREAIGMGATFLIFATCCVASFLFVMVRLPETKGVPLERIADFFISRYGER